MATFLDKTGLDTFWAKIKSTFQTLGNLVTTSTGWGSTPSDTKYPSEKLVKTSLDAKAPNAPSEVAIASGDKIVITDASDSNKIKRASTSFDTGVTNTYLSRNGTFRTVRERDLDWGGNFRTTKSPTETFTKQNSFFYPKPSAVSVEYSNNRTAETPTWTDYGLTDNEKRALFSGNEGSVSVYCGKKQHVHPGFTGSAPYKDLSNENIADQGLRITIACRSLSNRTTDTDSWIYCYIRGILLYMSTQSAGGGTHCVIEKQNGVQYKDNSDEWVTLGDYKIQGDSGWNSIPYEGAFGGGWSQTSNYSWVIRFTIWSDKLNASPNSGQTGCLLISSIAAINHIVWSATNPVQRTGFPFSYSYDGTMTLMQALPLGSGGTGATTKKAAEFAINGGMAQASGEPQDSFQFVFSRVGSDQSATNGVFIYRTAATIWSWIKGKISSVLGLSESNGTKTFTGNAATATTAQNYDTSTGTIKTSLDGKVDFGLSNNTSDIGNGAPAADCISYWGSDNIPNNHIKMVYNQPGAEDTLIFSKRSTYGSIVKYGYSDKYVYILRNQNGTWKSNNWEKISAGYADSAGSATTATTAQNYDTSTGTIKTALAGKSDTSHTHVADANDVTDNSEASSLNVITDTTEIVTTNTAGYTSSDKRLYRRPAGLKIWPWIKSKLGISSAVGSSTLPVYFDSNGQAKAITTYNGNASSADYLKYQRDNEINFKNVPSVSNGGPRTWFNYRNGDSDSADSSNKISDYLFGNRNNDVQGVRLHAEGIAFRSFYPQSNEAFFAKITWNSNGWGTIRFRVTGSAKSTSTGNDIFGTCDIVVKCRGDESNWHAFYTRSIRSNDSTTAFLQGIYYESGQTFYIGVRKSGYGSRIHVEVIDCCTSSQSVSYESTSSYRGFTYEIGDFNSSVTGTAANMTGGTAAYNPANVGTATGSSSTPVFVDAVGKIKACTSVNADTVDGFHISVGSYGTSANTIYFY